MSGLLILAILALAFLVVFQIAKASEYVSVLKGEEKSFLQSNRINAFLFIDFLVLGLIGVWYCNELFYHKTLLGKPAASEHGEKIDLMMWITLAITGLIGGLPPDPGPQHGATYGWDGLARNLREVARTAPTPGLPFIAAKGADTEAVFQALVTAVDRLSPEDRDALSLRGIVRIAAERYLAVPIPPSPEQIARSD